jgi:hypothetical protein
MKQFVILFRQGPHLFTEAGKARRQAAIVAWAREQNARGHRLEPRSLARSSTRPGIEVTGGDHGKWPVSAVLFVTADNLNEATALATSHPARNFNATVEVSAWPAPVAPARALAA